MTHEATKASTRRVRFADSVGRELVTIFLVDLISNFYSCSLQSGKNPFHHRAIEAAKKSLALPSPPTSNISHNNNNNNNNSNLNNNNNSTTATHHSFSFRYSPLKSSPHFNNNNNNTNSISRAKQNSNSYEAQEGQQKQQARKDIYVCDFTQPISLLSFKDRVRLNKVHLETCQINNYTSSTIIQANYPVQIHHDHKQFVTQQQQTITHTTSSNQPLISISCTIRVLNLSFEKSVTLRFTTDDWHTFTDCQATYKPGSCDGWSDKFIATFNIQQSSATPTQQQQPQPQLQLQQQQQIQRIKFALKFVSKQEIFWDNNGGLNYLIKRVSN